MNLNINDMTPMKLFDTFYSHNLKAKNRLMRSATWENLATENGGICESSYNLYEELAKGSVGTIITGFTSVDSHDQYFGGMMRLSDDFLIPEYKKLTEIIKVEDCRAITQLALGGYYKKSTNGNYEEIDIDNLSKEDIRHVVSLFVKAAQRAETAGFEGVQIHAAHFFFLSRFISPLVNHRDDEYGGAVANRARILLEILNGIRGVSSKLHVTIKINCNDFYPGGLSYDESMEICKMLSQAGIDSIEVSGNGTSRTDIRTEADEGYFVGFAERLAEEIDTPVICVGGFRSMKLMEEILSNTKIAAISLSRPLIREPDLPNKFLNGFSSRAKCISCNACYRTSGHCCVFVRKEGEK